MPKTDKSGEDPTECEYCGFKGGRHQAYCPLSETDKLPQNAPRDYSPFALRVGLFDDDVLTERYLKATARRFSGEPITGFGSL